MKTSEVEEMSFEVYFKNCLQPVCVKAQKYQLATTAEDQVIQFFQPGGVLLLHIYVQPSDNIRIETMPLPESRGD